MSETHADRQNLFVSLFLLCYPSLGGEIADPMAGRDAARGIESGSTVAASKGARPPTGTDSGQSGERRRIMGVQDSLVAPTGKEIRLTEYAACAG